MEGLGRTLVDLNGMPWLEDDGHSRLNGLRAVWIVIQLAQVLTIHKASLHNDPHSLNLLGLGAIFIFKADSEHQLNDLADWQGLTNLYWRDVEGSRRFAMQ
jgi:hypothetical protein